MSKTAGPTVVSAPPGARWGIVALLMAFSFMSWFNRVNMSVAYDVRIKDQYGISEEAMGFVYSALLFTYMIFMTPGGWFIDRFGAKKALVVMGVGLAVFCVLTGMVGLFVPAETAVPGDGSNFKLPGEKFGILASGTATVLLSFLIIRALMGIVAAPMYPSSARMISRWLPFEHQASANGLVTSAALVGIAVTFVVFGALIDWFDWPAAFWISCLVTALLTLVWAVYAQDSPGRSAFVNQAEQGKEIKTRQAPAWWTLLTNRSLIFLTLSYAAIGYFEYLFFFWMHYYFEDVLHLGKTESRYYAGIPNLAMAAGMALGGWLSDRLVRVYGYRLGRVIVPVVGMIAGAGWLFLGLCAKEPAWIVTYFSFAMAAVGATEGPFWTTAIELGGRRGGTAAGIVNTGGNGGGLLAPVVTPWVSKLWGWGWGISLGSMVCLVGVVLWLWIDPRERVEDDA